MYTENFRWGFVLAFLLIVICPFSSVYAATYYVDYANSEGTSSDRNNGISPSSAWIHSPGDPRATANADVILSAGDIIIFKGGVTYGFDAGGPPDYIAATASGSNGKVITYRSGHVHSPTWGSERALIDASNADLDYGNNITGAIALRDHSYIKIQGLRIQNLTHADLNGCGAIGWKGTSGGNIEIDDCHIFNSHSNGIEFQGRWGAGTNPKTFIVKNSEIDTIEGHGIYLRAGVDDVIIENNIIHDIGLNKLGGNGVYSGSGSTTPMDISEANGIHLKGNEIYDSQSKGPCNLLGNDILIENNYFHGSFEIGLTLACKDNQTTNNAIIRNNLLVTNPTYEGVIRMFLDADCSIDSVGIFNNTLVGAGAEWSIALSKHRSKKNPAISNVIIQNNILIASSRSDKMIMVRSGETSAGFVSDHNHYYFGVTKRPFYFEDGYKTLSEWQTMGFDDQDHVQNVSPSLDANYKFDSTSDPGVDAGADLSNTGFSYDKDGVTRPQGAGWDIGAHEFMLSGGTSPRHDKALTSRDRHHESTGVSRDD